MSLSRSPNSRVSKPYEKNHDLPVSIMKSPTTKSRSPAKRLSPKKQASPKRSPLRQHKASENRDRNRHLEATPASQLDSASFGMTPQREMLKYRADNDKVVGYYKKVMSDIRHTIKNERQQVQRYLH